MQQPQKTEITPRSWMTPALLDRISRGRVEHQTNFTRAERKIFRRQKPIKVSEWAEKHRILTMSALPGPWRNRVTPYLQGVMDALGHKSVRELDLCKAPQTGGSEAAHNFVGWCIDRNPGPVLYCYPDELTARENSRDRILPMIRSSAKLRSYLTGAQDDESLMRINLQHMPVYLAWSGSPSRLANKPIKIIIADEVDKYAFTINREAGPLQLLDKRLNTYRRDSKFVRISTPTIETGNIWQGFQSCPWKFRYHTPCPLCGETQLMVFDQIKWPEGERDPERMKEKKPATYQCIKCEGRWNDGLRNEAVAMGQWLTDEQPPLTLETVLEIHNPSRVAFHLPSWISPFVSLSETAAAFLDCFGENKAIDRNKHKDFCNNHKAEPYFSYQSERQEDHILALRDDRPRGVVPGGDLVVGMTAAVDTQDNGFWYEIRAYGSGHVSTSWCVREGFISADWRKVEPGDIQGRPWAYHPSFDALRTVLWEDVYMDSSGNRYPVELTMIDSAGHRTTEVYDFCRAHRGHIIPLRGEQRMQTAYKFSTIDTYPGTNKPIPGGVRLLRVNVTFYKGRLSSLLDIAPADPGAHLFHAEYDYAHARHYTAEYENDKGVWECLYGRDNHLWDCSVYNLVASEVLGLRYRKAVPPGHGQAPQRAGEANPKTVINPYTLATRSPFGQGGLR